MCDGLGRQFSYSCPNTTLFQQRMLICDHWYMVNCSKSELDYSANLLIGQKDKPFVDDSSENPYHRTPRPDLETHPYAPRFQNDYRQAKSQFGTSKNLVGADTENTTNGQYFLPSHWSTHYTKEITTPLPFVNKKYSKIEKAPFRNEQKKVSKIQGITKGVEKKDITTPSRFTLPPFVPKLASSERPQEKFTRNTNEGTFQGFSKLPTTESPSTQFTRNNQATFQGFITTTPNIPTRSDQIGLPNPSKLLQPPRLNINFENRFKPSEFKPIIEQKKTTPFDSQISNSFKSPLPTLVSQKPTEKTPKIPTPSISTNEVEPPSLFYQPPKLTYNFESESSTMDPETFYKLIPSKDLQPPKIKSRIDDVSTIIDSTTTSKTVTKKDTAVDLATLVTKDSDTKWKDLRQMFFIPEYEFPLDLGSRPSYDSGVSSFQVRQAPPNPEIRPKTVDTKCDPKCDPAFLIPGTCKPCVMIRR